jgi:hypothetical protein
MSFFRRIYFLQQLDKSTLSYASVFDLAANTHLVGYEFSALGSIVYAGMSRVALFTRRAHIPRSPVHMAARIIIPPRPPSCGPLARFQRPRLGSHIPSLYLTRRLEIDQQGITLSCMTAAHNFSTLLAARFFLGLFEATVAPTFVTITAMWWRRREQTQRTRYVPMAPLQMHTDTAKFVVLYEWPHHRRAYPPPHATTRFDASLQVGSILSFGLGHIKSDALKPYQVSSGFNLPFPHFTDASRRSFSSSQV